jgi:hypothetical protein
VVEVLVALQVQEQVFLVVVVQVDIKVLQVQQLFLVFLTLLLSVLVVQQLLAEQQPEVALVEFLLS